MGREPLYRIPPSPNRDPYLSPLVLSPRWTCCFHRRRRSSRWHQSYYHPHTSEHHLIIFMSFPFLLCHCYLLSVTQDIRSLSCTLEVVMFCLLSHTVIHSFYPNIDSLLFLTLWAITRKKTVTNGNKWGLKWSSQARYITLLGRRLWFGTGLAKRDK